MIIVKTKYKQIALKRAKIILNAKSKWKKQLNKYVQNTKDYGRRFWKSLENKNHRGVKDIPALNFKGKTNITEPEKQAAALHSAMTNPVLPEIQPQWIPWQTNVNKHIDKFIQHINSKNNTNNNTNSNTKIAPDIDQWLEDKIITKTQYNEIKNKWNK